MRTHIFLSLFSLLLLVGCAEVNLASHVVKKIPGVNTSASQGTFKIGNPYKIKGVWYRPKETYNFTETGIASWYGPQFHGKKTANGEIFDMNELTAAHRTLQIPSLVRVTNLENGRSLIVRVNDRGPFARGRVIDLSKRSAELLGFKNQGTAKVKIQVLPEESRQIAERAKRGEDTNGTEVAMNDSGMAARPARTPITTTEASQPQAVAGNAALEPIEVEPLKSNIPGHVRDGNFLPDPVIQEVPVLPTSIYVQAGSFANQDNALRLAKQLQKHATAKVYPAIVNGQQFYRVRLGPVASVTNADILLDTLTSSGQSQAVIVVE